MSLTDNSKDRLDDEKISAQLEAEAHPRTRFCFMRVAVRSLAKFMIAIMCLLLALMLCVIWAVRTETGTQSVFSLVQAMSAGTLKFSGISGKLADQITIDELSYQSSKNSVRMSGISLQWQPRALLDGQVLIDTLEVSSLRIASVADSTPAQLPADLRLPLAIKIWHAALGRLNLATLQNDGTELSTLQLSALTAQLDSTQALHTINGALTSPWGKLQLHGQIASSRPFALNGTFKYQGQAIKAIPNMGVNGSLQGSLEQMTIAATAISDVGGADRSGVGAKKLTQLTGGFNAEVMAFSTQPLRAFQANIEGLNPADFHASAPQAMLQVRANLKMQTASVLSDAGKTPLAAKKAQVSHEALSGSVELENRRPARIDEAGLPVLSLRSDVEWSDTSILLKNTHVQLAGNGSVSGHANIRLPLPLSGPPLVESNFNVSGLNLARLDKRIQATQIAGSLQMQTSVKDAAKKIPGVILNFQAQLRDPRASLKVDANYLVDADSEKNSADSKNNSILRLTQFELLAADSRVQGKGEINFSGQQQFKFQGNLKRFDPSRWLKLPAGRFDADLLLDGQLQPRVKLNVQLPHVTGAYAGQGVAGAMDASWQQDVAVSVKKLDLQWGKNTIHAHGIWGNDKEGLLIRLEAPDLPALSPLFAMNLTGNLQAEMHLLGSMARPAGKINLTSQGLGIDRQFRLDDLNAQAELGSGQNGSVNAEVLVRGARGVLAASETKTSTKMPLLAEQLNLSIKGNRDAHLIDMNARLNATRQFTLNASGGLKTVTDKMSKMPQWSGQIARLSLNGKQDLSLLAPMQLDLEPSHVRLGNAQFSSSLGKLILEQFDWTPASIKTRGQMADVKLMEVLNLIRPQYAVEGDLLVSADWDLQLKDNVRGVVHLQRQSGDIRVNDVDGTGQALALGVNDVQMTLALGGLLAGTDAERIALDINASGARLGNWHLKANSQLRKIAEQWRLPEDAALAGDLQAELADLQWIGPWLNPGLALKGKLKVDATFSGALGEPKYQAQLEGRELEVAFASEGVLLPNGSLSALINEQHIKLNHLRFSNKVSLMPKHAKFRDINYVGQTGEFVAAGEIDIGKQSGSIQAQFQKFPLLQRKDRWVIASGQTSINQSNNIWALTGKLVADGAYFKLPKSPPPSLSGDVVVTRGSKKNTERSADSAKKGIKTRLDVTLDMGPQFVFVGSGLDTALSGTVRLRSNDGSPLQASGSIRAEDGLYEGYGQKLTIERGILTFQGSPGNPGLNILALRKGLEVEAGVEVSGTVSSPQVRLVSEPSVPDAEKLSWLVLGTGTADIASNQTGILMSAAGAIFGDDSGRNIPRDIVQGLGFDEFSLGAAETGGGSKLPGQTVAGATAVGSTSGDQVVSIGKRLMPGLVLSVERGLSDASGALKLSWQLTRRISIIGRKGTEGSVDAYYTFSFH